MAAAQLLDSLTGRDSRVYTGALLLRLSRSELGLELAKDLDAGLRVYCAGRFGDFRFVSAPSEEDARYLLAKWRWSWSDANLALMNHSGIQLYFPPVLHPLAESSVARLYNPGDWYNLWPDLGRRLAEAKDSGLRVWEARGMKLGGTHVYRFVVAADDAEAHDRIRQAASFANIGSSYELTELSIDQIHAKFVPIDPPLQIIGDLDLE